MRRTRKHAEWTGPLPWQLEAMLVIPGFAGAFFAVWKVYDAVESRSSLFTELIGTKIDVMPILWQLKIPLGILALLAALKWHQVSRKWICRKIGQYV